MTRAWIVLPMLLCGLAGTGATARAATEAGRHASHRAAPPARAADAPSAAPSSGWSAPCGREPAAPVVDTKTVERYNASVDQVTLYEKAARAYNACVAKAATAEQTAISDQARSRIDAIQAVSGGVQKRIAANFNSLTTALRDASPKLQPGAR